MFHTKKCQLRNAALTLRMQWWSTLWPGYCRKCGAAGTLYYPGSYFEPPEWEPCVCLEESRCPRCGAQHQEGWGEDPEDECPVCGWKDQMLTYGQAPECYLDVCDCWMYQQIILAGVRNEQGEVFTEECLREAALNNPNLEYDERTKSLWSRELAIQERMIETSREIQLSMLQSLLGVSPSNFGELCQENDKD